MELRELEQLAKKQSWTIEQNGKGLLWRSPTGELLQSGAGVRGSDVLQLRTRLRRIGLEIPGLKKLETPQPPMDILALSRALDAAVQMIEELADQFATFRKAETDATVEARGKIQGLIQRADKVDIAIEELRETAAQPPADPIAAFRARLA